MKKTLPASRARYKMKVSEGKLSENRSAIAALEL
jgi:hypothetical protein